MSELSADIATAVIQEVSELPDYTSPEDNPDLLQCTVEELTAIVTGIVEDHITELERNLEAAQREREALGLRCDELLADVHMRDFWLNEMQAERDALQQELDALRAGQTSTTGTNSVTTRETLLADQGQG